MPFYWYILYLMMGTVTGVFSGLLGIGGGVVLVPLLMFGFHYSQSKANGLSLTAMLLPVGLLGVLEYYKAGKVSVADLYFALWIALGIFLGAPIGAKIALVMPDVILKRCFSGFMVFVAAKLWFSTMK